MSIDQEVENIISTNKMINLNHIRDCMKIAMEQGMPEEAAKALFYKDIIEEQKNNLRRHSRFREDDKLWPDMSEKNKKRPRLKFLRSFLKNFLSK